MEYKVIVPPLGESVVEGTIVKWLKKEGDEVKQGEPILEIETDKVAIDVEAPASGILSGILIGEGETVPIATVIAYILEPGEALPEGAKPSKPAPEERPKVESPVSQTDWEVPVTPVARNMAAA